MTYRREWSRSCLRILRLGLAVGLLGAAPAAAQLLYGGLVGAVNDSQGAVVPGARVVIVNTDTNFTREAITDAQGAYSFTNIQAGPYVVKVSLQGFREAVQAAVPVRVGQISHAILERQHVVPGRLDQEEPLKLPQLVGVLVRQIARLRPVGSRVVEFPDGISERPVRPSRARRVMGGDGCPSLVVDAAIA